MLTRNNPIQMQQAMSLLERCQTDQDMDACRELQQTRSGFELGGAQFATTTVGNRGVIGMAEGGTLLAPEEIYDDVVQDEMDMQDPFLSLHAVLGDEDYVQLEEAMQQYPVVSKVAEMAIKTTDGEVDGMGGSTEDGVPARLSPGEYVFSVEAVDSLGLGNLDELHEYGKQLAASK